MGREEIHTERSPLLEISHEILRVDSSEDEPEEFGTNSKRKQKVNLKQVCVLFACLFLQMTCEGLYIAMGVIYVELIQNLSSSRAQAALVQSLYKAMLNGSGILFVRLMKKEHLGQVICVGSLVATAGLVGSSFTVSVPLIIGLTGIAGGVGMGAVFLGSYVAITLSFAKNRMMALASMTAAASLGSSIFPLICNVAITSYRWNGTMMILGGVTLNCVVCGMILHVCRDTFKVATPDGENEKTGRSEKEGGFRTFQLLKDYIVWIVLFFALLFNLVSSVETLFIVDLSILRGFSRELGSVFLTLIGLANLAGRLIVVFLVRLCTNKTNIIHLVYGFLCLSASHCVILTVVSALGMALGCTIRGLFKGIVTAVIPGVLIELQGIERYSQIFALQNIAGGVGGLLSGYFGGLIVDLTGGYDLVFIIATGGDFINSLTCVLLWYLGIWRRRKSGSYPKV